MPASYSRGAVLKCFFPYDNNPAQPGPLPHYCLFVDDFIVDGQRYALVCYGTSKLDSKLLSKHQGLIFSIPSNFINGTMPGSVTHFIADHVAVVVLDGKWHYENFTARLDFIRQQRDPQRLRLFKQFIAFEQAMMKAGIETVDNFIKTGCIGLPSGKRLRD